MVCDFFTWIGVEGWARRSPQPAGQKAWPLGGGQRPRPAHASNIDGTASGPAQIVRPIPSATPDPSFDPPSFRMVVFRHALTMPLTLRANALLSGDPVKNRRRPDYYSLLNENDSAATRPHFSGAQPSLKVPIFQWRIGEQPPPFTSCNAAAVQLVLDVRPGGVSISDPTTPPPPAPRSICIFFSHMGPVPAASPWRAPSTPFWAIQALHAWPGSWLEAESWRTLPLSRPAPHVTPSPSPISLSPLTLLHIHLF